MTFGKATPILRIFDETKAREFYDDGSPGAAMRIETSDVDAFHAELLSKGYKYARPGVELMSWGTRDMCVKDPFGNRLTFTTAIST